MRPPFYSPITRISVRPDPGEPNAVVARRRAGVHGQPHSDATFALVRRLVEQARSATSRSRRAPA